MKEAGATSILSRRWRYLWTLSPTLDLDGTELFFVELPVRVKSPEIGMEKEIRMRRRRELGRWLEKKGGEYVRWVDRVVGCSTAERLVEFRLLFDLTNTHATNIDGWLDFAVSRKVERLELNFRSRVLFCPYDERYNFPYGKGKGKGNFPDGLKMMKKLLLHNVNVSGEALEHLLGNCPLLEQLTVSDSCRLTALQITRTFPSFKCLEIISCKHLGSLVIRDSHLVTLKYTHMRRILDFQLLNAPLLTQLWIKGNLTLSLKDVVAMFSPLLPQLQMLNIYFARNPSWDETKTFLSDDPTLLLLKQLEVTIGFLRPDDPTLLPLINLIRASPCLQRFMLQVRQYAGAKYDNLKFNGRVYPASSEGS